MELEQRKCVKLTYLYHTADTGFYESLQKYLAGLKRGELIHELPESRAGANVEEKTIFRLEEAQVIILLISSNFDDDKLYNSREIVSSIQKCYEKGTRVWPIIVRPLLWEHSCFQHYTVFFGKDKAVTEYQPLDIAYKRIAEKINVEIVQILSEEWAHEGDMYYHQMDLQKALYAYNRSISYTPAYPFALLGIFRAFHKQRKFEEAKPFFNLLNSYGANTDDTNIDKKRKNAIDSDNKSEDLTYICCKGHALLEIGRPNEARTAFQEIYKKNPVPIKNVQERIWAEAHCGEGDAFFLLGHHALDFRLYYDQALAAYRRSQQFSLDHPMYLAREGEVYAILGTRLRSNEYYEKALEIYQQVIHHHPDYALAYVGQGKVLYHLHRPKEALVAYDTALNFDQYEARAYGERAYVLLALNNSQEALSTFEKALSLDGYNARYYHGKGQALALLGRPREALEAYDHARECGFKSVDLLVCSAAAFLELGDAAGISGQQALANFYYEEAFDSYNRVLEQAGNAQNNSVYEGLGKVYSARKDWQNALLYYKKAVDFAPYKADAYLEVGKTLIELGNYTDAFAFFKNARSCCNHAESKIDVADVEIAYGNAYRRIAETSQPKDHFSYQKKALECYKSALSICERPTAYIGLGKTYAALHYHEEAIDALNQALKLKPQFVECYFVKGNCYYELGQPSEAYSMYKLAIASGFDTISLQVALGDALIGMKRYLPAIQTFDDLIEQGEVNAHIYCRKGIALYAMDMYEDAVQSFEKANRLDFSICAKSQYRRVLQDLYTFFEKAVRSNVQEASVYKYKGDVLLMLEEHIADAIDAYTKAIAYGDGSPNVYNCRAEAYERLHEYRRSLKDYCEALKIDPDYQLAQQGKERLGNILILQGQRGVLRKLVFWWRSH